MKTTLTQLGKIAFFFFALSLFSCQDAKDLYSGEPRPGNPQEEITPPAGFDWSTIKTVRTNITVSDEFEGQYNYLIEILDQNPLLNVKANVLSRGVAKAGKAFSTDVDIPNGVDYLYIKQMDPKGRVSIVGQAVQPTMDFAFAPSTSVETLSDLATRSGGDLPEYSSIPEEAVEVTGCGHDDWFESGGCYKITKDYSGGIYHSGRGPCTLYVSGTWTPPARVGNYWSSQFEAGLKVVVMPGGVIESDAELRFNTTATLVVMPGGTLACKELYLTNDGVSYNMGTIVVGGKFKFDSHTDFYSTGAVIVSGLLEFTNNCKLTNRGNITASDMKMTSSANVYNECSMYISNHLLCNSANASLTLQKGTIIASTMEFNNARIALNNGSMLKASEKITHTWNNTYTNEGEGQSLVKAPFILHGWGGATYTNNIILETDNQRKSDGSEYGANEAHNYYSGAVEQGYDQSGLKIVTTCGDVTNPGNGGGDPEDPDLDPIIDPNTYTYLFEDQWPAYGDYDMNDVVLRITNLTINLNKEGLATSFSFDAKQRAVGAKKAIASAVMFDRLPAGTVASVSYSDDYAPKSFALSANGVESDQVQAVVPLVDDAHYYMGKDKRIYVNTEVGSGENVVTPMTFSVSVELTAPIEVENLTIGKLNFFIIPDVNTTSARSTSRKEVHMLGYQPSARANTDLFGSEDDASNAEKYYLSKDNLVWAIVVPSNFRWAKEFVNIKNAYTYFESWVTSGGAENVTWWETPVEGKVFNH